MVACVVYCFTLNTSTKVDTLTLAMKRATRIYIYTQCWKTAPRFPPRKQTFWRRRPRDCKIDRRSGAYIVAIRELDFSPPTAISRMVGYSHSLHPHPLFTPDIREESDSSEGARGSEGFAVVGVFRDEEDTSYRVAIRIPLIGAVLFLLRIVYSETRIYLSISVCIFQGFFVS